MRNKTAHEKAQDKVSAQGRENTQKNEQAKKRKKDTR